MKLSAIIDQYQSVFLKKYETRLLPSQRKALKAIQGCRTPASGLTQQECTDCKKRDIRPMSCGHRNCPQCQNTETSEWLARQQQKLLPVAYFMVTFTIPEQLRALAWQHQKLFYNLLFKVTASTINEFGQNPKNLDADMGMTGVLHTHTRRQEYHPHIHFVVPGGGINPRRKEWRKTKGQYLFNGKNLAKVYRAKMLKALNEAGLLTAQLKQALPKEWIVNCQHTGKGLPALKYLSRYLYKGVISESNIIANNNGQVIFSYTDSQTKTTKTRTLSGEDFLWLILRHVLPRGFRRVRDYGFLHSNAKKTLKLVQLVLCVMTPIIEAVVRPVFVCKHCGHGMKTISRNFLRPT